MRSRELAAPAILNAAQIAANAIEVRDGTTVVTSGVAVIRVCDVAQCLLQPKEVRSSMPWRPHGISRIWCCLFGSAWYDESGPATLKPQASTLSPSPKPRP